MIKGFTKESDAILDPFMGHGSIPFSCIVNGRKSIGIDASKTYFDVARKRINDLPTKLNLFEADTSAE